MEKKIGQLVYGMLQQTKVKRMKTGTKLVKRIDPTGVRHVSAGEGRDEE